jgi:hypothetical protein
MVKTKYVETPGLLQPLSISTASWSSISMDLITKLTKSDGKIIIMTIVDWFTKYAYFILLSRPYTIIDIAQAFFVTDPMFISFFYEN